MRRHFVSAIALLGGLVLACEKPGTSDAAPAEGYPLEELGVEAVLGAESQGDPLSVLHRALDAVLLEDRIIILDASPPFARAFDLDGQYLSSAIEEGDGPGELRRPVSIGRFDARSYLVNEPAKLLRVAGSGEVLQTVVDTRRFLRGAIGCNGDLLKLSSAPGFQEPGRITRSRHDAPAVEDTVARLDSIRSNSRRAHPLLAHATATTAVFYSEEVGRSRFIRIDCDDGSHESVEVEPFGRQEFFEPTERGTHALHPAASPRPAGVVAAESAILWARQEEVGAGSDLDSVTVVTMVTDEGDEHRIRLEGWYQLVDSFRGRLLLIATDPVPRVVVLDRAGFLRAVMGR